MSAAPLFRVGAVGGRTTIRPTCPGIENLTCIFPNKRSLWPALLLLTLPLNAAAALR